MTIFRYSRVAEVVQYFEVEADSEEEALVSLKENYNPDRFLIYMEETPIPVGEFVPSIDNPD